MAILFTLFTFTAFSLLFLFIAFLSFLILSIFTGKSIGDPLYPPVKGTIFNLLPYFKTIYDYHTDIAKSIPTYRFLADGHSEFYTTDSRNIEHILKTRFEIYSRGKFNQDIMTDLFGQGIFAVDGEKWRQQRKLASYEFSTRVLRDFSCSVFRRNAAKLVGIVSGFSQEGLAFDMQVKSSKAFVFMSV